MTPSSVLVIEQHPLMREALYAAITGEPEFIVAAQAVNYREVLDMVVAIRPDVVLLAFKPDIILFSLGSPWLQELETVKALRGYLPDTAILVLTVVGMEEQTKAALDAGAQVVLSKSTPRDELICALRKLRPARR